MKSFLTFAVVFFLYGFTVTLTSQAQRYTLTAVAPAPEPEHICSLEAHPEFSSFRTGLIASAAKSEASATIDVTYIDTDAMEPWPQAAIDAFEYAKGIWETHLQSSVTIEVDAFWKDFGGCNLVSGTVLGSAGPTLLVGLAVNGQPSSFYPVPLGNALNGSDFFPAQNDINANFNMACDDGGSDHWYFGTDGNVPAGEIDFVSVVLHELGHGLGFVGSADVDDGAGSPECDGTDGNGCLSDPAFIYDRFIYDATTGGDLLTDTGVYTNPSSLLGQVLTQQTGSGIFFDGTAANFGNSGAAVPLYSPNSWSSGSSYSHVDEATFNNTSNNLMTPSISSGEASHMPGAVVCGMFQDMGWPMGTDCQVLLPVSLARFDVLVDGRHARLEWETASETNNAGFEIQQHSRRGWRMIGWVDGQGTTDIAHTYQFRTEQLGHGSHLFRLKQIDFDGTAQYSALLNAHIVLEEVFALTEPYPNPFNPEAQLTLTVQQPQVVRIELMDALGRQVQQIFAGEVEAGEPRQYAIDGQSLPSGAYWIRATGETFQATKQALLIK